jgi:hypothetical protein
VPGWARESVWLGILVALLIAGTLFAFFELPKLVVSAEDLRPDVPLAPRPEPSSAPTALDLVQARNGVRTAAVALLAGVGAAFATGFASRTYYLTRRTQADTHFAMAIDQLGSEAPQVQVSAIGELERLARVSPARHRQIITVLTTFLRDYDRPAHAEAPPASVQAAFDAVARRRTKHDRGLIVHLQGADLRQVVCEPVHGGFLRFGGLSSRERGGARLRRAVLRDAQLDGASLRCADLRDADLMNAHAPSVRLDDARLDNALFEGAQLQAATLDRAIARGAAFKEAQLRNASMRDADLRDAMDLRVHHGRVVDALSDGALLGSISVPRWRRR